MATNRATVKQSRGNQIVCTGVVFTFQRAVLSAIRWSALALHLAK